AAYHDAFGGVDGLIIPAQHPAAESSWHLYVLRWELSRFTADRRTIYEALRAENIGVNVHYIPVYKQPYYRLKGYDPASCPNAESYYSNAVSLPIFPRMTDEDVRDVIAAVRKVYDRYLRDSAESK